MNVCPNIDQFLLKYEKIVNANPIEFTFKGRRELANCSKQLFWQTVKIQHFSLLEKMASNMPIWHTLPSLTGGADIILAQFLAQSSFAQILTNCTSVFQTKFLEITFLRSSVNFIQNL